MVKRGKRRRQAGKQPTIDKHPVALKKVPPAWVGSAVHDGAPISWRFSAADRGGPFTWTAFPPERLEQLLRKFADYEGLDLSGLRNVRSEHEPHTLEKAARDRLAALGLETLDRVVSYHLQAKERVWCLTYPDSGIMFVLWWDPGHNVYRTPKKHT
jgi:hypothetical protein